MLPSRPPRKPSKPFPLVPLLAAGMVTLGLAQLVWQWQVGWNAPTATPGAKPFNAMVEMQKRHASAKDAATRQPPRLELPPAPPLMVFGNTEGAITLTVFADPADATHRVRIVQWQRLVGDTVRIELRYAPTIVNETSVGMAFAVARSRGLENKFWATLMQSNTNTEAQTSMAALAKIGIPLAELRETLTEPNPKPLQTLNADLAWGAAHRDVFRKGEPLMLLEGYLIQAPLMRDTLLKTYIQRRLNGEPLVQPEDFL